MGIVNVGIIKKIKILEPSLDEQKEYIELKKKSNHLNRQCLHNLLNSTLNFKLWRKKRLKANYNFLK